MCCDPGHIGSRLVVPPESKQAAIRRFFKEVAETSEAEVGLVETRVAPLDDFLEHRGPDPLAFATVSNHVGESLGRQLDRLGLARFQLLAAASVLFRRAPLGCIAAAAAAAVALAHQIVVINEFVAVGDQQVGTRLLDADADHPLRVLAQLRNQRREIRVAADDDKGIDMQLRIAEIEGIDDKADVRRILARLANMRNLDQFEIGLVHLCLEGLVALPVAIGLLDHDAALGEQAFEHRPDVELLVLGVAHTEGDVLEITKERHARGIVRYGHEMLST